MSSNFCYINPAFKLKRDLKIIKLVSIISERASEIANYPTLKNDQEFLKFICLMIEHGVDNKKGKKRIDKKDICFQVYKTLYAHITAEELVNIDKNIEFLIENGQIVKKSFVKIVSASCYDWIKRKFL
jgi:hypothetical protein